MIEAGHPVPDAAGLNAPNAHSRWPMAPPKATGAGVDVGRRVRQLDRPGKGTVVRRQAGSDARAAALGRGHRRDQHRAQTSLAHQRRAARASRFSREARHHRDFGCAGRRSSAIGSGPTVPDPTTSTTRAQCRKIQTRSPARRSRARLTMRPINRPSRVTAFSGTAIRIWPRGRRSTARGGGRRARAGYDCVLLGDGSKARPACRRRAWQTHARTARARQTRGDPFRR